MCCRFLSSLPKLFEKKPLGAGGIMVLEVSLILFLSFSFSLLLLLLAPNLFGAFPLVVYFCYL